MQSVSSDSAGSAGGAGSSGGSPALQVLGLIIVLVCAGVYKLAEAAGGWTNLFNDIAIVAGITCFVLLARHLYADGLDSIWRFGNLILASIAIYATQILIGGWWSLAVDALFALSAYAFVRAAIYFVVHRRQKLGSSESSLPVPYEPAASRRSDSIDVRVTVYRAATKSASWTFCGLLCASIAAGMSVHANKVRAVSRVAHHYKSHIVKALGYSANAIVSDNRQVIETPQHIVTAPPTPHNAIVYVAPSTDEPDSSRPTSAPKSADAGTMEESSATASTPASPAADANVTNNSVASDSTQPAPSSSNLGVTADAVVARIKADFPSVNGLPTGPEQEQLFTLNFAGNDQKIPPPDGGYSLRVTSDSAHEVTSLYLFENSLLSPPRFGSAGLNKILSVILGPDIASDYEAAKATSIDKDSTGSVYSAVLDGRFHYELHWDPEGPQLSLNVKPEQ